MIPMIRKYFVQKKHFLTEEEVMELAAISQSSPGAIAVNLSSLAGYKTAGLPGAVVSCIASVLPEGRFFHKQCFLSQYCSMPFSGMTRRRHRKKDGFAR